MKLNEAILIEWFDRSGAGLVSRIPGAADSLGIRGRRSLVTGLVGFCPLYRLLRLSTRPVAAKG
jgi:hypothetical protein